jgi:hypothetical protein
MSRKVSCSAVSTGNRPANGMILYFESLVWLSDHLGLTLTLMSKDLSSRKNP